MPMPKGHVVSPLRERFEAKVDRSDPSGCWFWTGCIAPTGYGRINLGGREAGTNVAHRVAYELFVGAIPDGLQVDHLCRVRRCVNPEHLEVVTPRENSLRGTHPMVALHLAGRCQRGHSADRSYRRKGTNRVVYCRDCRAEDRKR